MLFKVESDVIHRGKGLSPVRKNKGVGLRHFSEDDLKMLYAEGALSPYDDAARLLVGVPKIEIEIEEEPVLAPEGFPITGYDEMSISDVKKAIKGLGKDALQEVLAHEENSRNRKGAVALLQEALREEV